MWKALRRFLTFAGFILVSVLALCFTTLPWRAYEWLGSDDRSLSEDPDVLVMLGGGGVPSESGLMRSYVLAEAARTYPNALVAVAMPDTNDISTVRMKEELILRGIKADRMVWEDKGRNTREQAMRLKEMLYADGADPVVVVVTSPNHIKRSLLTFRKAGFEKVFARTEFGVSLASDLKYTRADLGTEPAVPLPEIGQNNMLRYQFWTNLSIEVRVLHEFAALAYYRVMGWL